MKKIGYQGHHGTFSEIAALHYFRGEDIEPLGYKNFPSIMEDVQSGKLDAGVLPVENTTTGIIARSYDLFSKYDIHAVGEINVPIRQNLIALPSAHIEEVREVYSHPEALSQCRRFFSDHPQIHEVPFQDTARAVEYVKECGDPSKAAIGSWRAAEYYGMKSLEKNIQDEDTNMTRFLVISHEDPDVEGADKISFMIVLQDVPGALYNALGILAKNGINIVRLESRPLPSHIFEYLFYMDIEGSMHNRFVKEALHDLKQRSVEMKIFGAYRKAEH